MSEQVVTAVWAKAEQASNKTRRGLMNLSFIV
jgi:hypothetical protein